ncbi:MAG: LytTR family transcriptional regulator [Firmicutes bacterium]|uniref:LytTR family transcriptional regulator n=1 Tax=Candidatus Scybalomonas excrementavium TaxID=2840943 RepID=A0A9D9I333_9FIRM|nr:LytTR family transcriptional regulator [Candidatus Scybalomonas excrementavium]
MKVEIKLIEGLEESYAVIYTELIDEEIQNIVSIIGNSTGVVTAFNNERIIVLKESDIYVIRVEDKKTVIYCKDKQYISKKRLCELEKTLKSSSMKISKTTLINLKYIEGIEAAFGGMMLLIMKNGVKDYVSRRYLPDLKKYLGI